MAGGGGGTEELNLVPYLDIMVNLIMFMVVVTAYLVQLKEAPIMAPSCDICFAFPVDELVLSDSRGRRWGAAGVEYPVVSSVRKLEWAPRGVGRCL